MVFDELEDTLFEDFGAVVVDRRQDLPLEDAEPDFDLVEPRRVLGQPEDADGEWPRVLASLLG